MVSRANRECRPEYPTGHNKGNESPSRNVPRVPGGANPVAPAGDVDVQAFGTPIGGPPEVNTDRDQEREDKLNTPGTREQYKAEVAEQEEGGKRETIAEDNRESRTPDPEQGTDLSAMGAGKTILDRRNPEIPE